MEHFSFQDINSISSITNSNLDEPPVVNVVEPPIVNVVEPPVVNVVEPPVVNVVEPPVVNVVEPPVVNVVEPDTIIETPSKFLIVINYDKTNTTFPVKDMKADIFTIENNKFSNTVKSKWENILWFLNNYNIWKKYEYLWFPDNNIEITEEEIMTYLNIVDENEIKISQPSIYKSPTNKKYVHKVLLHNSQQSKQLRKTHFVENKLVCFKRTFVENELLPFLKENENHLLTGWGLDIWWSFNNQNDMYIVDKIKIEAHEEDHTKNNKGFIEMKYFIKKYKLRLKI